MAEKNTEKLMHDFAAAYMKRDVDGLLSFFAEDAVYQGPEGVFKGKEEIKRYLTWVFKMNPELKIRDAGIGRVVKGSKGVYEFMLEAVGPEGRRYETPGVCTYEIDEGKIKQYRVLIDRLSVAKQGARGVVSKWIINSVLNAMEKGLR